MSYGDKVSSLLETAKSFQKQMNIDYDEDDKALAEMYASRILDSNEDINTAVLWTVPDYLIPLVYQLATEKGWGTDYKFDAEKDGAWVFNPETGETESNGGKEYEIEYEGKTYHIITDFAETIIYKENEIAQPIDMEEEEWKWFKTKINL